MCFKGVKYKSGSKPLVLSLLWEESLWFCLNKLWYTLQDRIHAICLMVNQQLKLCSFETSANKSIAFTWQDF